MSKTTKRKHVVKEVTEDFKLPESNQEIVKVRASRGNNLHEVESSKGEIFLVSMPTKYRRNVWIKRDDFVIVDPIPEGYRVKAEIVQILYKHQINYIRENDMWPKVFNDDITKRSESDEKQIPDDMLPPSDSDEDCVNVLNINRPDIGELESESNDSDTNN